MTVMWNLKSSKMWQVLWNIMLTHKTAATTDIFLNNSIIQFHFNRMTFIVYSLLMLQEMQVNTKVIDYTCCRKNQTDHPFTTKPATIWLIYNTT